MITTGTAGVSVCHVSRHRLSPRRLRFRFCEMSVAVRKFLGVTVSRGYQVSLIVSWKLLSC
jgi:hypothetical protein